MAGLIQSVTANAVATVEVLQSARQWRIDYPEVLVDPEPQWKPGETDREFVRYGTPVPATVFENAVMIVSPLDAARLRAAGVVS